MIPKKLLQSLSAIMAGEPPNSCHLRELELCSVGFMSIFQNPNGLPAGELELRRQCDYFNESAQCLEDYSRDCLSGLQSPLVEMFSGHLSELGHHFCSPDSQLRRNYTKHVACLREVQRKHQRPCLLDFQVGFEPIHKLNRSLRLPTTCCNVNRLKECLLNRIEYECETSAVEMINWMIDQVAGSVLQLPCRNFDPFGDQCNKLLPKIGTRPHNGRNVSAISKVISGFTNVPAQ